MAPGCGTLGSRSNAVCLFLLNPEGADSGHSVPLTHCTQPKHARRRRRRLRQRHLGISLGTSLQRPWACLVGPGFQTEHCGFGRSTRAKMGRLFSDWSQGSSQGIAWDQRRLCFVSCFSKGGLFVKGSWIYANPPTRQIYPYSPHPTHRHGEGFKTSFFFVITLFEIFLHASSQRFQTNIGLVCVPALSITDKFISSRIPHWGSFQPWIHGTSKTWVWRIQLVHEQFIELIFSSPKSSSILGEDFPTSYTPT